MEQETLREKSFEFADGSSIRVQIGKGGAMAITLQAKHLGAETKITSATIDLDPDKTIELMNWIGEELVKEF